MSSIGENVQRIPTDEASSAATRAPFLHEGRIPCGGLAQGYGIHGLEAVHHVAGKYQGNAETAVLHGLALEGVDSFGGRPR